MNKETSGRARCDARGRVNQPQSQLFHGQYSIRGGLLELLDLVVDGLHRAGVEFRSLAEDFDAATPTGNLQLAMVLAFSEWWRNSIRDRSVAGQAKARAAGRFPSRRPSLSDQQREYIREERSKGVSQRELAKLLEVSRWTIQQVD